VIYYLLYALLYGCAEIKDRVGTQIYPENAPQGTVGECIVLRKLSGTAHNHLTNEADCVERLIQIDFYGRTVTEAEEGYELIQNLLSGYGPADVDVERSGTTTTVRVSTINRMRDSNTVDAPANGSDVWTKQCSCDFQIFHSQPVPTHA
jgi:hypothetical protein